MSNFSFSLPRDFSDYEWEVSAKGHFSEARLIVSERVYRLSFYDAVRLVQEVESEFKGGGFFFEKNMVVVRSVTRAEMEKAVEQLVQTGLVVSLIPE